MINNIILKYPSKCWNCSYARKVSDSLHNEGFCGCVYILKELNTNITDDNINDWLSPVSKIESLEKYSGWVYTRQEPFSKEKDAMMNFMLITKNVTYCPYNK